MTTLIMFPLTLQQGGPNWQANILCLFAIVLQCFTLKPYKGAAWSELGERCYSVCISDLYYKNYTKQVGQ